MPAPGAQSTFDGNPLTSPPITAPYRPGLPDFNSLSLQDDQEYPPDPSMPTANLMNSTAATCIVLGRMCQNVTLSVTYSGGNPGFDSFTASPTAVATNTAATTFTMVRTPGGAGSGDIFVYWAANTLPAALTRPMAHINGAVPGLIACDNFTNGGHSGVRIVTQNQAGAATDLPFTVEVM